MLNSNASYRLLSLLKRRMPVGRRQENDVFFVAFAVSALVFLLPIAVGLQLVHLQASAYSACVGLGLIALALWVWKHTGHLKAALLLYEGTLLALILLNVHLLGGVMSPVMVWLGIVPLLPLFIASLRWAYVFLALSFLAVLVFYMLSAQDTGHSRQEKALAAMMFGTFIVTQMVLVGTVAGVATRRLRQIHKDNRRLRILTEQLRLSHTHKDRFLSSVSHEMRTPLNAIHGYLDLLRGRHDLPAEAAEHIGHAATAAAHLLGLINDLLDYAQIRQGQFTLSPQPVQLPALLQSAHTTLRALADEKGLAYTLHLSPQLPDWVQADPHRLTQILLNLLGNAIKFTARGQVALHAHYQPHSPQQGTLALRVVDTGPGIPEVLIEKIFTPFFQAQVQAHTSAQPGVALHGNGLGLSITDSLVKAWRGGIDIDTRLGEGSTFTVHLPVGLSAACRPAPRPGEALPHAAPLRLLIVDDHAMNRMVAAATLRKAMPQLSIDQAENGQQGLEKLSSQRYDLVLLDIVMPDMSGIEVLQKVRQNCPPPYRHVKALAFTANLDAEVRAQCEQAGFDGFLAKPFNASSLINTLLQTLDQPFPQPQETGP